MGIENCSLEFQSYKKDFLNDYDDRFLTSTQL